MRVQVLLALAVSAALTIPVALAFACGPSAGLFANQKTYAPGEGGSIQLQNFYPGATYTLSMQGGGLLASGTVPSGVTSFSVAFTAPSSPGVYTIVLGVTQPDGTANQPREQTFEVVAPVPAASPGSATADQPAAAAEPAPADSAATAPAVRSSTNRRGIGTSPSLRDARPAARARRSAASTPAAVQAAPAVFEGSVPRIATKPATAARKTTAATARRTAPATPATQPSESSAQAAAWSGLGTGSNPAIVPNGSFPAQTPGGNTTRTASLILLGLGLAALGGVGTAEARRRRARGR